MNKIFHDNHPNRYLAKYHAMCHGGCDKAVVVLSLLNHYQYDYAFYAFYIKQKYGNVCSVTFYSYTNICSVYYPVYSNMVR